METSRGDAAAATWIVRRDETRPRRVRDADIPLRRRRLLRYREVELDVECRGADGEWTTEKAVAYVAGAGRRGHRTGRLAPLDDPRGSRGVAATRARGAPRTIRRADGGPSQDDADAALGQPEHADLAEERRRRGRLCGNQRPGRAGPDAQCIPKAP